MLRRILFAINLLRAMPAYCAVCLSGAKKLFCAETEGYMCEVGLTLAEIRGLYRNVKAYSKTKRVPVSMANCPA